MKSSAALLLGLILTAAAASAEPRVNVRCDSRLDVLGVLQVLAEHRESAPPPPYADASRRFASWRGHPAVAAYARAWERHDGEHYLTIALTGTPSSLDEAVLRRVGGAAGLAEFAAALEDFDLRSGAARWVEERAALIDLLVSMKRGCVP